MAITEQNSRRRRLKHSHGEQKTLSIDRISDLPDSVLCHILSFLRTRDSVRTSVLGKRWRLLWSYVPTLDFNSEDEKIVNRVILLREVRSINTFRLCCCLNCSAYHLETWLTFATRRGVRNLDLCLEDGDVLTVLPPSLFTCKTLVDLRLRSCGVIPVSGAVCLPSLKILHLVFVHYEADESLPHLLSGCPVLEELKIKLEMDMVHMEISSPTIKRLKLNFIYEGWGGRSERLKINTPALEYLKIKNYSCEHIKCGVLTSLINAKISFYCFEGKEDYCLYTRSVLEFVDILCNVKCLRLDFKYCAEIIDSLLSAWTTSFRNLTELGLKADYRVLFKMLEKADNLEILIFTEYCEEIESWTEPPPQVPTCLLSSLRKIKIVDIQDQKHDFEIIRYLLRNSRVLEGMKISYGFASCCEEIDTLKKISLFQRGSASCEVAFDGFHYGGCT